MSITVRDLREKLKLRKDHAEEVRELVGLVEAEEPGASPETVLRRVALHSARHQNPRWLYGRDKHREHRLLLIVLPIERKWLEPASEAAEVPTIWWEPERRKFQMGSWKQMAQLYQTRGYDFDFK